MAYLFFAEGADLDATGDAAVYPHENFLGIDPIFMKLYAKYFYHPKSDTLASRFIQLGRRADFKFLQVGGNDGFANDPMFRMIKRFGWKGIIVEPQKEVFQNRLSKTYRLEKNVILENCAIAAETGTKDLYKLSVSNSRWATGLATFNKEVMLDRIKNNDRIKKRALAEGAILPEKKEDYIAIEKVTCYSIQDLMKKHGWNELNLLQIDTEGFDFEVIKTINFESFRPKMISFEHHLLSKEDFSACISLLVKQGYQIEHFGGDTLAILID